MKDQYIEIDREVKMAMEEKKAIVALESTIISHGMPYPQNVETALNVEKIVRDQGAIPATIAIIKGKLKIGLSTDELEYLAKKGVNVSKVSRRDIPYIISNKSDGATTVASTMIISQMASIKVFATGGIGGVHRGAETSFDISADLEELGKTDVAVFCAGVKSILDIGLTLEYLETKGVPVLGYKTMHMPAFYSSQSGYKVDYQINSPLDIARFLKTKWDLSLKGGVIVANPIPSLYSMDEKEINLAINQALVELKLKGIKGKESTPFLLAKIAEITGGNSLKSNIRLIYNNAELAALSAVQLAAIS